jgi:hypothetical protein
MTLNFVNQNDVILVKKQKSTGLQPGFDRVLPGQPVGSAGSHRVFPLPVFSSTRQTHMFLKKKKKKVVIYIQKEKKSEILPTWV